MLTNMIQYAKTLSCPVGVLALVMALEGLMALAAEKVTGKPRKKKGFPAIIKELARFAAVAVAMVMDWVILWAAGQMGMEFGSFYMFGLLVTVWLILNESLAVLRHIRELGVPLPAFLGEMLERLKETADEKGEELLKTEEEKTDDGT